MLKQENWAEAAPEVSVMFHERFNETLAGIEDKNVPRRRIRFKTMLIAAAICVLGMGTVVMAGALFGWDKQVLDKFKPTAELQEQLPEAGIVHEVKESDAADDFNVVLSQVLLDEYSLYIEFEVTAADGETLNKDHFFNLDGSTVLVDGKSFEQLEEEGFDVCVSGGAGFIGIDEETGKSYYEISYLFDESMEWKGKTLSIHLASLQYADNPEQIADVANGPWNFEYKVEKNESIGKMVELDQSYDFGGYEIPVQSIYISSLGYRIVVDYDKASCIENDEKYPDTYFGDDAVLAIDARIAIAAIEFNDGTIIRDNEDYLSEGRIVHIKEDENSFIMVEGFGRIMDVNQIKKVYLMQGDVEIPIE